MFIGYESMTESYGVDLRFACLTLRRCSGGFYKDDICIDSYIGVSKFCLYYIHFHINKKGFLLRAFECFKVYK